MIAGPGGRQGRALSETPSERSRAGSFRAQHAEPTRAKALTHARIIPLTSRSWTHIGVIGIGWISYGLTATGKSDVVVTQKGCELTHPGPKNIEYNVHCSAALGG